ncbi:glycosyltransferase [Pedobacter sp. MR22-3]|uniref:glycosyltransferase n=1 Tax=Pedobacter TaxID=84567 RepID=UPI0022482020|nr:glycosyltransferase [Pedobacter sp. MR22-3]MCX2586141.1 glycosyltransferase [Pedobacter sp. MR22-3]
MISIIIASINKDQLSDVKENIAATIGLEHEIISFDNADGKRGLCEIYNEGAKRAKYKLLCYMHEDISIKTKDWGIIVVDIFNEDQKIGLIGIAGSSYKTKVPSGWFCSAGEKKINYVNILQRYKFSEEKTKHISQNVKNEKYSSVVVVDGVWFCTKKEIVEANNFDEETFKKFHCYDLDFSLQVYKTHRAVVTFQVLLEHFSEGNYCKTWIEETLKLHRKWATDLPIDLEGLSKKEIFFAEKYSFKFFLKQMKIFGYKKIEIFKIFWRSKLRNNNFSLFLMLNKEIWRS